MKTRSFLSVILGLLLASILMVPVAAQEEEEQEVDYNQEQYNEYQAAVNEEDLDKRAELIVEFVNKYPKLSLVPYAIGAYGQVVNSYRQQAKWDKVVSSAKTLLSLQPDNQGIHYVIAEAAFQKQDYVTAVEHGEEYYEKTPSPGLAYLLAIAHLRLDNERKFHEFGAKVIAETDPKDYTPGHFEIITQLRNRSAQEGAWREAANYASKVLTGFSEAAIPEGWSDYVNKEKGVSYAVLGRAAYERGSFSQTIDNYQKVLNLGPDRNVRAESHYYIGLSHWKGNKLNPAMESFAWGSVQRGAPHQDACQKYLVTLYKSTHNGSTAGLDEYTRRVTGQ